MKRFMAISLGRIGFLRALEAQRHLHQQVVDGRLPGVLLLLEHPHVYTLGRRGSDSDVLVSAEGLARLGATVHHTDRGGEVTYHGPGQLVGYPIVNLRALGLGPLKYVRALEGMLIETLAEFAIRGASEERPTGVWVGPAKIAAIGVRISRGVTMHGFALNVKPDLSYFDHIVPCGMPDGVVTSMAAELSEGPEVEQVERVVARRFGKAFGGVMERVAPSELGPDLAPEGVLASISEEEGR